MMRITFHRWMHTYIHMHMSISSGSRFDAPDPRMLNVLVDGVPLGSVNSPGLVRALFGVYLDRDAVSPSLKQNIASSVSNGI